MPSACSERGFKNNGRWKGGWKLHKDWKNLRATKRLVRKDLESPSSEGRRGLGREQGRK